MSRKRDTFTVDLFKDYQPQAVVERFSDDSVKAWSLAVRAAVQKSATVTAR